MSLTIERLTEDLTVLQTRKEQAVQNYNQILGAISIVEQMIYRLNNPDWDKKPEDVLPTMDVLPIENQEKEEIIQ